MERDEATTSSKGKGIYEGGDRGAGGKFRKPIVRKPPTTPYARPSSTTQIPCQRRSEDNGGGGGWFSKIVNPATRLISGGATRLFPSFFAKPFSVSDDEEEEEEEGLEVEQDVSDENPEDLSNIQIYRSTERGQGPASKRGPDIDENVEDKLGNSSDDHNFSEIEQMMRGKTFSRDDINRLTEILRSRIADSSDHNKREQNVLNLNIGAEATGRILGPENVRTSLAEKHSVYCQENIRAPVVEKQVSHSDKVMGAMSTPGPLGQDKVGASPIDIAKAYMGVRTSELGLSSPSVIFKDERTPLPTEGFSLKPSVPSPSPKSSICWPGAKVQDQRAYETPQTQRGRIGLHNLPRTPYSRAVHTRSTSKLQDGGDRSINISSNYWKQSRTSIFGDSQTMRARSSDDGSGSVGPMRRMRNKFVGATPSKGDSSSRPSNSVSFRVESSDAPIGFSPMVKQNLELGGSSSNTTIFHPVDSKAPDSSVGGSSVHLQSSEMARKILEGLDRSIITPQEKSAELKRATSWRKTTSSELTTSVPNGQFNEQLAEGSNMQSSHITQQCSAQRKEITKSSLCEFQSEQSKNDKATDAVNPYTFASNGGASSMAGNNRTDSVGCSAKPFMDLKNTHNASEVTGKQTEHLPSDNNQSLPLQNHIDGGDGSRLFLSDGNSESLNGPKRTATHTFGNKPALSFISVAKADPKRTVSFDNGSGFTFPVSASGTLSEPSTPSIMPSFSAIGVSRPLEKPALPPYDFGSKATDSSTMPSFSAVGVPRPLEKPALPPYDFGFKATDGSIMPSVSAVGVLQPLEKPAIPPYTFGSKTGTRPIVFSFPCTSSSSPEDGSTPKFDFGSDKKSRLSFSTAVDRLKRKALSESTLAARQHSIPGLLASN